MINLPYGKETTILYKPPKPLTPGQVSCKGVDFSPDLSAADQRRIESEFARKQADNPHFFDGLKWGFKSYYTTPEGGVVFCFFPTSYMPHNVIKEDRHPFGFRETGNFGTADTHYIVPMTINALQRTKNGGHILLGLRGGISDQPGTIATVGAGFVDREKGQRAEGVDIFETVYDECIDETRYRRGTRIRKQDVANSKFLGIVFGSNHDVTATVLVDLPRTTIGDVEAKKKEYKVSLPLKADADSVQRFLDKEGFEGMDDIPADHLLGDLWLFLQFLKKGLI